MDSRQKYFADNLALLVREVTAVDVRDSGSRERNHVESRGLFYYVARKVTKMTTSAIGEYLDQSHATVLYSTDKFPTWMKYNKDLGKSYKQIMDTIVPAVSTVVVDVDLAGGKVEFFRGGFRL